MHTALALHRRVLSREEHHVNGITTAFTAAIVRAAECLVSRSAQRYLRMRVRVDAFGRECDQRHYVTVLLFGESATEELAAKLGVGSELYVEGRLRLAESDGPGAKRRTSLSVIASRLELLGRIGLESEQRHEAEKIALRARLDAIKRNREAATRSIEDEVDRERP